MIPNFIHHPNAPGPFSFLLPPGLHLCTLTDVENELVNKFPTSSTRSRIFKGLELYVADVEKAGVSGKLWVDGSFVTGKNHPSDVDVISFVSYDLLNNLLPDAQKFVQQCLIARTPPPNPSSSLPLSDLLDGRESTKGRYKVHSFSIPCIPFSHPNHVQICNAAKGWSGWFGHTRKWLDRSGLESRLAKGMLDISFGDPKEVALVDDWLKNIF